MGRARDIRRVRERNGGIPCRTPPPDFGENAGKRGEAASNTLNGGTMIHNPALQTSSRGLAGRRMLLLLLGFTLILLLSLGAAAVAVVVALAEAPPAVTASVQDGAA